MLVFLQSSFLIHPYTELVKTSSPVGNKQNEYHEFINCIKLMNCVWVHEAN